MSSGRWMGNGKGKTTAPGGAAGGAGRGGLAQEAKNKAMAIMGTQRPRGKRVLVLFQKDVMILLLLEALGALLLLLFIVWWTMFSGRKHGELKADEESTAKTSELNDTSPPAPAASAAPLPPAPPSPSTQSTPPPSPR